MDSGSFVESWRAIARDRRQQVLLALAGLVSAAIVLQPGFGRLNYYFAFSTALAIPLLVGLSVIGTVRALRESAERAAPLSTLLRRSLATPLLLLTIPLVAVGVAAIFIRNCSPARGLLFYLFEGGLGALFAYFVAIAIGIGARRFPSTIFVVVWVLSLVATASDLYRQPRIYLYNHFVGFFSGAIYDEVIVVSTTFVWFRLVTLLWVLWLVSASWMAHDVAGGRLSWRTLRGHPWPSKLALALLTLLLVGAQLAGGRIGFSRGRVDVQRELSHRRSSEHFVFHVADALDDASWKRLLDDFEFRYHRLSLFFGVELKRRIHVYIYAGEDQKRRLMGAARTFVAKPWLHEVYLNRVRFGDSIVTHELAHVFAGAFGSGPFRIAARYGVLVNMGLVEGIAVAAEWEEGDYTPHQFVAAMRKLRRERKPMRMPELSSIMGTFGFWAQHAASAYTIAGSFVRFLVDRYGIEAFKRVYRGEDWRAAYKKSMQELAEEWGRFLDNPREVPLDATLLRLTSYRFNRRGVLYRVCGNEIARLEKLREGAEKKKQLAFAIEVQQRIDRYVSNHPNKRYRTLDLLIKLGRYGEARAVAEAIIADRRSSEMLVLYARLRLADVDWLLDRRAEALKRYAALIEARPTRALVRVNWIKIRAIQQPRLGARLRQWFFNPLLDTATSDELLLDLVEDLPSSPVLRYLLARRALDRRRIGVVPELLQSLRVESLPSDDFAYETYRVWGQALYFLGRYREAEQLFDRLARQYPGQPAGARRLIDEWRVRCRWRRADR